MVTQAELDQLEHAIARGARAYEYNGKSISYRSLEEMFAIQRWMRSQLGYANGDGVTVVRYDKGLRPMPYLPGPNSECLGG